MTAHAALRLRTTRQRIAALFGVVLLLYVALTLASLRWLIVPTIERMEVQDARSQIERIDNALQVRSDTLAAVCRDWAFWDDTYRFVDAPDADFVRLNLTEEATSNTPTDLIALFDARGAPVHIGVYRDLTSQRAQAEALLATDGVLYRHAVKPLLRTDADANAGIAFWATFEGTPLLVIAQPLLHSDRSGPANGVFVMAKRLGVDELDALQTQTQVPFALTPAQVGAEYESDAPVLFRTNQGKAARLVSLDAEALSLRLHLPAADGAAFQIDTRYERRLTRESRGALLWTLLLSTLGFVALVALIYYGLIAPSFLHPLRAMTTAIRHIEDDHDLSARLPIRGAVELRQVARAFNDLLQQVEADREEISLLSLTDELTRLPNRRRFEQVLAKEWQNAVRLKQSLAVIICDVDHFKPYNDHYGHPTGDDCLRRIAQTIERALLRRTDIAARYGGEEFVVVLPDTDALGALTSAERIVNAVRQLGLPHATSLNAGHVTLSAGVYAATPTENHKPAEWLALADAALYRAKAAGRDRVELASAGGNSR